MKIFLRSKDEMVGVSELGKLYLKYKNDFFRFALKNSSFSVEEIKDIYQEIFLAVCQNQKGVYLACSIKTYLFAIGKQIMYKRWDRRRPVDFYASIQEIIADLEDKEFDNHWRAIQEITYKTVLEMQEPCNRILMLFYWDQKRMDAIAEEVGYKNQNVAKNKKNDCKNKLTSFLTKKLKEEDLF